MFFNSGEKETAELLLGKFKWGHAFLSLNRYIGFYNFFSRQTIFKHLNSFAIVRPQSNWLWLCAWKSLQLWEGIHMEFFEL